MSARHPRFEVVRTDAGWHARFRASNGQVVFASESYTRRRAADNAVRLMVTTITDGHWWKKDGTYHVGMGRLHAAIEVREVDER